MKRRLFAVVAILVAVVAVNAQDVSDPPPKNVSSEQTADFASLEDLIHFGDLIEVDVVGSTEFDWRGKLSPEGFLSGLQFTEEPVYALCRDSVAVAAEIKASYSKVLNEPVIKVTILDRSNRPFAAVKGAVRLPQRFRLRRRVSLKEIIVLAGGLAPNTDGKIELLRQPAAACNRFASEERQKQDESSRVPLTEAETEFLTIDVRDLISGNPDSDPEVFYGDMITVREAAPVYVIGDVANAGKVPFTRGLTAIRAINAAGGAGKNLEDFRVRVYRRKEGKTEIVNLASEGTNEPRADEFELQEYDIVEVYGAGSSGLRYAPIIAGLDRSQKPVGELPIRIID